MPLLNFLFCNWLVSGESPSGEKAVIVVACSVCMQSSVEALGGCDADTDVCFLYNVERRNTYLASKKR